MAGRVFNGKSWTDVTESEAGHTGNQAPVPPILNGDGKIFISIPSFRDGERCGKTIVDIFQKAKDPDKIVIGVIDQSSEEDTFCLEAYCKEMGFDIFRRMPIRKDTTKVIVKPDRGECPRVDQIRKVSVHHIAAKGPTWARSLGRKVLGNEEFCMQIDSHTEFVQGWDEISKREWAATGNEFGIISTVPTAFADKEKDIHSLPRQCEVQFLEVGIPHFNDRGDGKVENLEKPLLSHAWSAGFSFSKCHLEELAPYDPFTPYIMGIEQFARFARFWTRGYDVYTPTQTIAYHNFQPNPDGHGTMEWMKRRKERLRQDSIKRIKSYLGLPDGIEGLNLSNLGIYGLGKRRTIQQMADFMGIDLEAQTSRDSSSPCGNHYWVPYDSNISPVANLYDKPDDLDPQPEYPLRTELTFYKAEIQPSSLELLEGDIVIPDVEQNGVDPLTTTTQSSPFPSATVLFVLWVLGLVMWCMVYMKPQSSAQPSRKIVSSKKSVKDV